MPVASTATVSTFCSSSQSRSRCRSGVIVPKACGRSPATLMWIFLLPRSVAAHSLSTCRVFMRFNLEVDCFATSYIQSPPRYQKKQIYPTGCTPRCRGVLTKLLTCAKAEPVLLAGNAGRAPRVETATLHSDHPLSMTILPIDLPARKLPQGGAPGSWAVPHPARVGVVLALLPLPRSALLEGAPAADASPRVHRAVLRPDHMYGFARRLITGGRLHAAWWPARHRRAGRRAGLCQASRRPPSGSLRKGINTGSPEAHEVLHTKVPPDFSRRL